MDEKIKVLEKLYTDPKSASDFAEIDALYSEAKKFNPNITKKDVTYYLDGNRT